MSTNGDSLRADALNKALEFIVKCFVGRTYSETKVIVMDPIKQPDDDAYKNLMRAKEHLKQLFGSNNISLNFSNTNVNLFDVYLDDLTPPGNVKYDPLDFVITNGFFSFKSKEKILISIFVSPRLLKEQINNILSKYKGSDEFDSISSIALDAARDNLRHYFVASYVTALISDRYRESRTSQMVKTLNLVGEINKINIPAMVFDGNGKRINEAGKIILKNYRRDLEEFKLRNTIPNDNWLYPNFNDLNNIIGISDYSYTNTENPLTYYKLTAELSGAEVNKALSKFNMHNSTVNIPRFDNISTRGDPSHKNTQEVDTYRSAIAVNRIIPYILYTTYLMNYGFGFENERRMSNAIKSSLSTIGFTALRDISVANMAKLSTKSKEYYDEYEFTIRNPTICNKNVVKAIIMAYNMVEDNFNPHTENDQEIVT
jgi:hypothetical protein